MQLNRSIMSLKEKGLKLLVLYLKHPEEIHHICKVRFGVRILDREQIKNIQHKKTTLRVKTRINLSCHKGTTCVSLKNYAFKDK